MHKAANPQAVRNTHAICSPGKIPAIIVPEEVVQSPSKRKPNRKRYQGPKSRKHTKEEP
jgi:hypothetical protein